VAGRAPMRGGAELLLLLLLGDSAPAAAAEGRSTCSKSDMSSHFLRD
jgi:hypothetical protein